MAQSGLTERALAAHAGWYADAAGASTQGVRSSRQADHLAFARAERANIDAALAWSETHDPLLAIRIVNGFGWAWIVLGDSRGAQRLLRALDAAGEAAPIRDRAGALLLAAWIEASTGRLELAREHIAAATELADAIDDVDLQARCCYYLAYVVSHDGEFGQALELTDRSRALYQGLDRPWDQAANGLFAARAAISAGDRVRAVEARDQVEHWLRTRRRPVAARPPRRDARRAGADRASFRRRRRCTSAEPRRRRDGSASGRPRRTSSPASGGHSARPATTCPARPRWSSRSRRPKPPATCAWRRSPASISGASCGRPEQTARGTRGARGGDGLAPRRRRRRAGRARRVPAGGARRRATRSPARSSGSSRSSRRPDASGDAPVEVFALDALARIAAGRDDIATARDLCEAADRRMGAASHFITELDRSRRPRGQADRLSITPPRRSPRLAITFARSSSSRRVRSPRWLSTTKASNPPTTIGDAGDLPVIDHLAQQQERPHDRQRGLSHLGDPDRADLDRLLREHHQPLGHDPAGEREDQHVRPPRAAHAEHVAVGDRQRKHRHGRDRTDRRHERRDVHVLAKVLRRHDVRHQEQHRDKAEHVSLQRGVAVGRRAEQHEADAAERDEREHERARIDVLLEQPRAGRHDQKRGERADQRGVGDAVVRRPGKEDGQVQTEEDTGHERLAHIRAS